MALTGMVYDRTQTDVDALREILEKIRQSGYGALTADEQTAVKSTTNKGAYNYTDANRVIAAWRQVITDYKAQGYAIDDSADTFTTYTNAKRMTPAEAIIYLQMVELCRNIVTVGDETPTTPESMDNLDFNGANDIERILYDVSVLLDNIIAGYYYAGELYAGEV